MPLEQDVSLDAQALTKMWVKHSPPGEGESSEPWHDSAKNLSHTPSPATA
jgi:hypothetical protein